MDDCKPQWWAKNEMFEAGPEPRSPLDVRSIQEVKLTWLVKKNVNGLEINIQTRITRFKADIPAFLNHPPQNKNY